MFRPKIKNKIIAILFAILPAFVVGSLVLGADVYYDIDSGTIMTNENNQIAGTLTVTGNSTLATGTDTTNTFGSGASSINTIGSETTPGALTLHGATALDNTFSLTYSGASTAFTATQAGAGYAATFLGGNVGVGTATPSYMLDVFGVNNGFRLAYDADSYAVLSTNSAGELEISSTSASGSSVIIGSGLAEDASVIYDGSGQDYYIGLDDTDDYFKIGLGQAVGTTPYLTINTVGNVGIGLAPTAYLTLKAGSTGAGTAPLKLTAGTNLTAPEAGAIEWDGTNLMITQTTGPTRKTLAYTTDVHSELTIGVVGSSPNADGMTLTDQLLNLEPANATNPGAVTAVAQDIGGAKTFKALMTGELGLTVTGAAVNLNADSNFATNINTGASTGAVTIGGGSNTVAVDSTVWDVTAAGAASFVSTDIGGGYGSTGTSISTDGNIQSNGALTIDGASTLTGLLTVNGGITADGGVFAVSDITGNIVTSGTIGIKETGATPTYYTYFQGGDQTAASDITYTLPVALPVSTSKYLQSTTGGALSWEDVSSGVVTVGSMTQASVFSSSDATGDWFGLGAAAGRIAFDDQATDFVNILDANVGIGTASPAEKLSIKDGNLEVYDSNDLGSESLSETDFATHAKWDITGDFDDSGTNAAYTHSTGVGTLTQTSANLVIAGVGYRWYKFTYTVSGSSGDAAATITTAFASAATSLTITDGTQTTYFQAAASPTDFIISATSTSGGFTLDDLTLKEIQGGDVIAGGLFTGGGTGGIKILADGSVGIGDSTPAAHLVVGSDATAGFANGTGDVYIQNDLEVDGTFYSQAQTVAGNILPSVDNTYDLGSATYRWQDLHLGPASLNIYSTTGTAGATANYTLGNIGFSTDALTITTSNAGTGTGGQINLISAYPAGNTTSSAFNFTTSADLGASDEVLQIGDSAGTFVTIRGDGSVGIGTTAPEVGLHIGTGSPSSLTASIDDLYISGELEVGESAYLGPMEFATDSGAISWIDMPVTSGASIDTVESYTARIDGVSLLTIYAESDGAGGIQDSGIGIGTATPTAKLTVVQSGAGDIINIFDDTTEVFTILDGGNIGIGTAFPAEKLSIKDGNLEVYDSNDLGSESLSEIDFATHANWDVTGDFLDSGTNAAYTHSTGAGTLTQTSANLATAGVGYRWYKFTYTVSGSSADASATITTAFASEATSLTITDGTQTTYFQAASSPTDFIISATSTSGGFTLDDLTLKEIQGGDVIAGGLFTGGGTGGIKILADGSVGINTTTPDAKLDIENTEDTEFLRLTDSTNADSVGVYIGSGTPESNVTAQLGSIYTDHANGNIYKKASGDGTNTGWEELTTGDSAHMAKMTRDAAQSIPNAIAYVKVLFDNEEFDIGDIADTTTDKFTIKKAGKYLVTASWYLEGALDDGENMIVRIVKNGSGVAKGRSYSAKTDGNVSVMVTDILDLAIDDYIEMEVYHNEGAAQNTDTLLRKRPRMSVIQLDDVTGGGSLFTDSGDTTYLTATSDDLGIGTDTATAKLTVTESGAGDIVNIFDDTTEVFTILDGGNIGINTSSPDAKLDIENTEDSEFLRLTDSTNADSVGVYTGSGTPESNVTAQLGSIYTDHANGKIYKKASGDDTNTGWEELTTGDSAHMAKMTRNASQSIASGEPSKKILFDNEEFDVGDIADATTGDKFTIKKAGKYLVTASWYVYGLDSTESMMVRIYKNGSSYKDSNTYAAKTDTWLSIETTDIMDLAVDDYLEMHVKHFDGGALDTRTGTNDKPRMSVVQLDDVIGGGSLFTDSGDTTYLTAISDDLGIGTDTATAKLTVTESGAGDIVNIFDDTTEVFTILNGGNIGIGTAGPDRVLDILDASAAQLRLTQADETQYADFQVDASGDLTITMSGDDLLIDDNLWVSDGSPAIASVSGSGNLIVENKIYLSGDNENMPRHSCPTGWVLVPGNSDFGTEDFCVMKYEAKKDATTKNPTSVAAGTPWVSVSQYEAKNACTRIGAHLMTDAEWMTVARNIEGVAINDMDDAASLQLATGHSDNVPANSLAATAGADPVITTCVLTSTMENASNAYSAGNCEIQGDGSYVGDDNDKGFYGTGQQWAVDGYVSGAANKAQLRTHVLSNGNVLWDIAGNVWEWTDAQCDTTSWYSGAAWIDWNNANLTDYERIVGGSTAYTSANGVGQYYGCTATGNAFLRGGAWAYGASAGVFALALSTAPTAVGSNFGFRCAR